MTLTNLVWGPLEGDVPKGSAITLRWHDEIMAFTTITGEKLFKGDYVKVSDDGAANAVRVHGPIEVKNTNGGGIVNSNRS